MKSSIIAILCFANLMLLGSAFSSPLRIITSDALQGQLVSAAAINVASYISKDIKRTIASIRPITIPPFLRQVAIHQAYELAFYYGSNPPLNQLKLYNNVVFEPGSGVDPIKFATANRKAYAYASLGEAISLNQYSKALDKTWAIGKNSAWQSLVLDQTNSAWQAFFLNNVITPLWDKGYRGFFLDTLDSYRLATSDPLQIKKQQAGLIHTIKAIKAKYPDAKLILNRGFEILPDIHNDVNGVVVESLFGGWDNKNKRYYTISNTDRKNILDELEKVKKMGLPITIVDYVAPDNQKEAVIIAKKIAHLGFNPWVTNGALTKLYLFNAQIMPRKILIFYQNKLHDIDEKMGSYANKFIAMPLNYMGYATEIRNVNEPLPKSIKNDEYAGIVMAVNGLVLGKDQELYEWYLTQIKNKIPLVILNDFGFTLDNERLKAFEVSLPMFPHTPHTINIIYQAPMIGYEFPSIIKTDGFIPLSIKPGTGTSLLTVKDEVGTKTDIAAITSWGGYYTSLNFLPESLSENFRWSINPFLFFKEALKLPDRPIPDTTSENGMRLMFTHIDGDGFANKGEWFDAPYVGEIMSKEILERYSLPTTVSIIQGEIAPNGIHPAISQELEDVARKIFALPHVEIASHTFSHPYNWQKALAYTYKNNKPNPNTLNIPNYHFNLEAEITGSVNYINNKLAPPNKKCKVFLWSGEGDVQEKALQLAAQLELRNLNPGTLITKYNKSITKVASLGINEGPYFQVFAPIGNDYETQGGTGRFFYSNISILNALKLTDKPRRLKPIDIYLHFFTVAQPGGIKAIHAIYEWALKQAVMNIYASEYSDKVGDFNNLVMAKKDDGWLIETNDYLREMRIPHTLGYPDLINSKNVIGYNSYNDDYYIHLGPGGSSFLTLSKNPPTVPYLVDANARVTSFIKNNNNIDFSLEGYAPFKFTFANMNHCSLWNGEEKIKPAAQKNHQFSYKFQREAKYDFSIHCE